MAPAIIAPFRIAAVLLAAPLAVAALDQAAAEADYVVVGGGAGGCAAASRLADEGADVLVLERGDSDHTIKQTNNAHDFAGGVLFSPAAEYIVDKEGKQNFLAKVLGGGSSINGGIWIAETPDFFRRHFGPGLEDAEIEHSQLRVRRQMTTGPHPVGNPIVQAETEARRQTGQDVDSPVEASDTFSHGTWTPYTSFDWSDPAWPRTSGAHLLRARSHLRNLRVHTGALVHKILFEGKRAVGVEVDFGGGSGLVHVRARKAVLLTAGAFMTPQLLQVSGVGEPEHLSKLGVDRVVAALPVGSHFVARTGVEMSFIADRQAEVAIAPRITYNDSGTGYLLESHYPPRPKRSTVDKNDAWAQMPSEMAAQVVQLPNADEVVQNYVLNRVPIKCGLSNPRSRGTVRAVSLDVTKFPEVVANRFQDPQDRAMGRECLRTVVRVMKAPAFAGIMADSAPLHGDAAAQPESLRCLAKDGAGGRPVPRIPCFEEDASDEALDKVLEIPSIGIDMAHYFGTASVGHVVDLERNLAVRDTEGLHVLDASVFPVTTRTNPVASIMTLADAVAGRIAAADAGGRRQQRLRTARQ